MRPCGATRAGTQAPPLSNSIIFFHTIPYKQNSVHAQFTSNEINRPCTIRPYQSPPNHAVCHYPIGVILSIAQGWQVQRSLPWVTMQARRLPHWGLYFFHHIAFLCPPTQHIGGGNASRTPAPITQNKKVCVCYDFGVTADNAICFKASYSLGATVDNAICFKTSYSFGITVDDAICFKTSYSLGVTVASP